MTYAPDAKINPNKIAFNKALGADMRRLREKTEQTLDFVAMVVDPDVRSRDRLSKVERGLSGISMYDYLRIMWFFRDVAPPDHPAVALARMLLPRETLAGGR